MIAVYDLKHCPPTFDTVTFLLRAEAERIERGASEIDVHILPGPVGGFRDDTMWPPVSERVAVRRSITEPACCMLPSVRSVTVHESRPNIGGFGCDDYSIDFAKGLTCYGKGVRPLRPRREYPRDPRLITITLREAEHHPQRNSDVSIWTTVADMLAADGYRVVFVRDTFKANDPLPGYETAPHASVNLEERGALYRSAALNIHINGGPFWFCLACDAPTLLIAPRHELGVYDANYLRSCGVEFGGQFPGAPAHQRVAWGDVDIIEAVTEFFACV